MNRTWDVIHGIAMICGALALQSIVLCVAAGSLCVAATQFFGMDARWTLTFMLVSMLTLAVAFNLVAWLSFRRQRVPNRVRGIVGAGFALLPRAVYRIWFGREIYSDAGTGPRGFRVLPVANGAADSSTKEP